MKRTFILATALLIGSLQPILAGDKDCAEQEQTSADSKLMLMSKLMDAKASSRSGEDLGAVKDLIVDTQHGKITHAVLAPQGETEKDQLIPVPWRALTVQSDKQLTVNVDKARLAMAPMTDQSCAQLADPEYVVTVEHYYIVPVIIGTTENLGDQDDSAVGGSSDIEGADESSGTGSSSSSNTKDSDQYQADHDSQRR